MEKIFAAFADQANLIGSAILTTGTAILGGHGYLFLCFLALNAADYLFGVWKAQKTGTLSSAKGAEGIKKKISYWVVIGIAFMLSYALIDIGATLGVDLGFVQLIGWFTLAVYVMNELTSITENLIVLGVEVPEILVKALAVAKNVVDEAGDRVVPDAKEEEQEEEKK